MNSEDIFKFTLHVSGTMKVNRYYTPIKQSAYNFLTVNGKNKWMNLANQQPSERLDKVQITLQVPYVHHTVLSTLSSLPLRNGQQYWKVTAVASDHMKDVFFLLQHLWQCYKEFRLS